MNLPNPSTWDSGRCRQRLADGPLSCIRSHAHAGAHVYVAGDYAPDHRDPTPEPEEVDS